MLSTQTLKVVATTTAAVVVYPSRRLPLEDAVTTRSSQDNRRVEHAVHDDRRYPPTRAVDGLVPSPVNSSAGREGGGGRECSASTPPARQENRTSEYFISRSIESAATRPRA